MTSPYTNAYAPAPGDPNATEPDYDGEAYAVGRLARFVADGPGTRIDNTLTLTHANATRLIERLRRLEWAAPVEIIDNGNEWPYPALRTAMHRPNAWLRISEADAEQLRDVVPPGYVKGGFYVGEADSHDHATNSPNVCVILDAKAGLDSAWNGPKYFARIMPHVDALRAWDAVGARLTARVYGTGRTNARGPDLQNTP